MADQPVLVDRDRATLANNLKRRQYPLEIDHAEGMRIVDIRGCEYVDWTSSAGVASLGYDNLRVRAAIDRGLDTERFGVLACHATQPAVDLASRLINLLPGEFDKRAWFGLAGTDAMDFVAKFAPLREGRPRLVCYIGGFAGSSLGASAISGHHALARPIGGGHISKAPYPNPYRCPWGPCDSSQCSLRCLRFLETEILTAVSPAHDTAAIILEAIQSDNGEIVPPDNYLPALRDLCDKHGIWLIFDEIKVGYARTGHMFAFQQANITADAIGLGKPMAGGMLPLSAVVGRVELLEGPAFMTHTLAGFSPASRAGIAVLDEIERLALLDHVTSLGARLGEALHELKARHHLIGDVRGRGLIWGAELVTDRTTKTPATQQAAQLVYRCYELGLLTLYCGPNANVIEIMPPLTITPAELERGLELFDQALTDITKTHFDNTKLDDFAGW